jgi:hypothetical protein
MNTKGFIKWLFMSMGWDYISKLWFPMNLLFILQMIWVWRATLECYWQGKTKELGDKPVPVPLCPPQIPDGLSSAQTLDSAVRGRQLTA